MNTTEKTINLDTVIANRTLPEAEKKDTSVIEEEEEETQEEETEEVEEEETQEEEQESSEEEEPEEEEKEAEDDKTNKAPVKKVPVAKITIDSEYESDGNKVKISDLVGERNSLKAKLSELEGDEFLQRFIKHYQTTKDPKAFLESQATNWDKETDFDVIRRDFEKENSGIAPALKELAFKKHLTRTYGFDPRNIGDEDTESDDFKLTQDQIRRDAEKVRSKFKEEQKKFAIPETVNQSQENQRQAEEFKKRIDTDADIITFRKSKMLKLGITADDGSAYGYAIENPEKVIEMITSEGKFWKQFVGPSGKLDQNRLNKSIAYSQDPDAFERQIFDWGKKVGAEGKIKADRNIDGRLKTKVVTKEGQDPKKELLGEFLKAKKNAKK